MEPVMLLLLLFSPQKITADNTERSIRWQIPIGTMVDVSDKATFTGFYYSIAMLKKQTQLRFELITPEETIDKTNSFQLAQSICRQMSNGVFALFGTKSYLSQDILTSYSDKFHMPFVTVSSVMEEMNGDYEIHMKPPLTNVLRDLIIFHNWNNISYLYDSDAGLLRYQDLRESLLANKPSFKLHMRRLHNVKNAHDDLRALDSEVKSEMKYILIDLESEDMYDILLKQIREVGMNKDNYVYILSTQDLLNRQVEKFRHGGVSIYGFQLVDYSLFNVRRFIRQWRDLRSNVWPGAGGDRITVGAALAVDAAHIIHETINMMVDNDSDVFQTTFRRAEIYNFNNTKGIPCSVGRPWMHGPAIIRRIKEMAFDGLSGPVTFNEYGVRKNFNIGVYQVSLDFGPAKIGYWSSEDGYHPKGEEKKKVIEKEKEPRNVKIVISVLEKPFYMLKTELPKNGTNWTGNARYEGFSVDLIEAISEICNFEYNLTHTLDVYGQGDPQNKSSWTGIMGILIRGEADISVAPLTITKDRQNVVDFSEPFMNSGISIMIKIPDIQKPGVFAFLQPFSEFLWLCIVISYFVVSVGIFIVGRFSPSEWVPRRHTNRSSNHFDVASSFWFTMGSMMLQGSDTCPRSNAGRIVGGAWWFVVLITISSYTANLAAFLTIEKLLTPIESADDLSKQTDIAYGTLDSGASQDFFKKSEVPVYKTMWNFMSTADPSVFVQSMPEGVERVRNSKGKYAFILESVYNEFFNNQEPCNTMQVGPNLNNKGYGLASPKGSDLRDKISIAVLQLKENGLLIKLKNKWWVEKGGCGIQKSHSSKKRSLSLNKVAGVFFILIGGLVFSIVMAVIHFHKTKLKVQKLGGFFMFGTEIRRTDEIEYTRCPSENSNGRAIPNGRTNVDKNSTSNDEYKQVDLPDLNRHVCKAVDNSLHGNKHFPVSRVSAKKKT